MIGRAFVFLAATLLCGCASIPPAQPVTSRTLEGNPLLPAQDVADLCSPKDWNLLRMQDYRAYVIFDVQILADGSVSLGKARASYPANDASWTRLARAYAKRVQLNVVGSASHIPPQGEIFVVFFEENLRGNMVLIYGRQNEESSSRAAHGRAQYIRTDMY